MLYANDFRRIAREALSGKWGLAVGTGFVAALLGVNNSYGGSSSFRYENVKDNINSGFGISPSIFILWLSLAIGFLVLFYLFLGGVIQLGYCRFNLNLIDGTNPRFQDLFSRFDIFWKGVGLQLLVTLYTILWSLLFIIPGIIAALSYSMAPYILAENPSMGIQEAIGRSKEMMDGNKWRLFCLNLSFIGWGILSMLTFGIGLLWLNPYVSASYAAFYNEVSGRNTGYLELEG